MGSIGVLPARHAGRGGGAEGQRPGAALFDRQGHRRAAVPAGAGGPDVPRQVVHRHRGLPARRRRRRPGGAAVRGRAWAGRRSRCRGSASCCVGAWMAAAYVARRQYVENLRESIHQHRVDAERASMPVMDRDTTALISSRLKGTHPRDRLRAQPVRDGARPQGAPGRARPAASRASPRSAGRRSRCWRAPATPRVKAEVEQLLQRSRASTSAPRRCST